MIAILLSPICNFFFFPKMQYKPISEVFPLIILASLCRHTRLNRLESGISDGSVDEARMENDSMDFAHR